LLDREEHYYRESDRIAALVVQDPVLRQLEEALSNTAAAYTQAEQDYNRAYEKALNQALKAAGLENFE